jgi:hypothetical protein
VRVATVTLKPAFRRFRAIGAPIIPNPINPICIVGEILLNFKIGRRHRRPHHRDHYSLIDLF